jgi:hypothetical protein
MVTNKHLIYIDIVDEIVYCTNARREVTNYRRTGDWTKPVTRNDIRRFIGIKIVMQIHDKPTSRSCWSKDQFLHTPIFSQLMTLNRYEYIKKILCTYRAEDINAADNFWKIRKLFDMFNENFTYEFDLGQEISIDESMLKWKGHHTYKRYLIFSNLDT